jgi:hypothetical protein
VVLQQGPSTLPDSRANLREWAGRWAAAARDRGATPALYMVWPTATQARGFELVARSYREGAFASGVRLLPAGEAWQEALRSDPALPLYQPDQLHPTEAGTYLAALVITHGLTGARPEAVPSRLTLRAGRVLEVPEDQAATCRVAAAKVADRAEAVRAVAGGVAR